jgi:hypothetical protein
MNLHPKIRAASIASAVMAALTVAGTVAGLWPDNKWSVAVLACANALTPLVAGYMKSAS